MCEHLEFLKGERRRVCGLIGVGVYKVDGEDASKVVSDLDCKIRAIEEVLAGVAAIRASKAT